MKICSNPKHDEVCEKKKVSRRKRFSGTKDKDFVCDKCRGE